MERVDQDLMGMSSQDLAAIPGIGKSILEAILSLKETGSFPSLDALIGQTPAGVMEILQVKGLGPKKVRVIWRELDITSTHELMEACQSGQIAQTKGFGEKTQETISQACQLEPKHLRDVRPPNGLFTPQTLKLLHQWQYRPVMWSVVPEDWVSPGVEVVVRRVIQQVQNGSLIVLHDGYHGGEDVAQTTDRLIPQLLQQGYKFVTIEELSTF